MKKSPGEKITIDMEGGQVRVEDAAGESVYAIGTPEAFAAISRAWLRSGWDTKYVYSFTWLGRPSSSCPRT